MTPEQYVARIGRFVRGGRYRQAMEFVQQHHAAMLPLLNIEQLERVSSTMEMVDTILDYETIEAERQATSSPESTARVS